MTELDPKVFEAAVEIFTAKLGPCFHSVGSIDAKLIAAFKETLDAADLVEREDYNDLKDTLRSRHDLHIRTLDERDKARRLAAENGKMLAALRAALDQIADHAPWGGPDVRDYIKWMQGVARAVLTDTEEAAAQWVRVDDEHVVIEAAVLEPFIKYIKSSDGPVTQFYDYGKSETGPGISADVPDDFVLSKPSPEIHAITLGHFRGLLAAAPQAGETRKLDRVSPETHPSSWNQRSGFKKTTKAGAGEPEGEAGEEG